MPIPAKVVIGGQDHNSQSKGGYLDDLAFSKIDGRSGVVYQREANHNIILTEAVGDVDSGIVSQAYDKKNQDDEDDIDNCECRASSLWVDVIRSWPGGNDFLCGMHI